MYLNRFLADGVLVRRGGRYGIHHERALGTVPPYLAEILALQERGTRQDLAAYIDRWAAWGDDNRRIAALLKDEPLIRYSYETGPLEPAPAGLEGDLAVGRVSSESSR